jgi:hypothetical protein
MRASFRITRFLAVAALCLMVTTTACTAVPAPRRVPGAYDAQDAALRQGANLSTAVARAVNDIADARGATAVVLGNVALVATDLRTAPWPFARNRSTATTPDQARGSAPGGAGRPYAMPGSPGPTDADVTGAPQGTGGAPMTRGNAGGMGGPGGNGTLAPPSRDRPYVPAAQPGGGAAEGPAVPGGTPNEYHGRADQGGVLGPSGEPGGPATSNATGQFERYTRLAQSIQADYPQIAEVLFVTNPTHAQRLRAIVDAQRRGQSIAEHIGELAAIAAGAVPAGITRFPGGAPPQPGAGANPRRNPG